MLIFVKAKIQIYLPANVEVIDETVALPFMIEVIDVTVTLFFMTYS